ncbi:hypothetical protein [Granulicella aggregans]|uniref:hypothetical protein n=1 Tax=Granulicella aggregans TaxID=474949 RepID=UPI0021DF500D|nr:hypothetical protein [Granulicella aggregans]
MSAPKNNKLVPLRKAAIEPGLIHAQVETLHRSAALENQKNAKELLSYLVNWSLTNDTPPTVQEITEGLGRKYDRGSPLVRNTANRLRNMLEDHYASAGPDEIWLVLPPRSYMVYTPRPRRVKAASPNNLHCLFGRVDACITEPAEMEDVSIVIAVRGRIDALDADLRVWLVVYINKKYFLQCRVSRRTPAWEHEIRCEIIPWVPGEGRVFNIMLVAADSDGDYAMYGHWRTFGTRVVMERLPSDIWVLDTRKITRNNLRRGYSIPTPPVSTTEQWS